jgi:hypothetical protein
LQRNSIVTAPLTRTVCAIGSGNVSDGGIFP